MAEKSEKVMKKQRAATKKTKDNTNRAVKTKPKVSKVSTENIDQNDTSEINILAELEFIKKELSTELTQAIREEYHKIIRTEVRRANRRRRWNNLFHDLVIIIVTIIAVYFGYRLYDIGYFDFEKSSCRKTGTCETAEPEDQKQVEQTAGPIKDADWFLTNYKYLYENIATNLDADEIAAYYLYSGDYKVQDLPTEYRLAMAYNQLTITSGDTDLKIPADVMLEAYRDTFGETTTFEKKDFQNGCNKFEYDKSEDIFILEQLDCRANNRRMIVEKIDQIYEEGEVIYILTNAAIYDKVSQVFYNFNNPFLVVASNVQPDDIDQYVIGLNRYQYKFKKNGEQYYIAGITKIK